MASIVLPTPGTSSIRTWPSANRATTHRRTASRLPWITYSTASVMRSKYAAKASKDLLAARAIGSAIVRVRQRCTESCSRAPVGWSRASRDRSCSPPRAAGAPASSAPSTSSSARSTCTARRSTSASRSSTTATSWRASRSAARSSSTRWTRSRPARTASCRRTVRPPRCTRRRRERDLQLIDATCPLVTKVHVEAIRFAKRERTIVLIGHAGHEEVEGTMGQAPARTVLVQDVAEAEALEVADPDNLSYITQTTLSVDDTRDIVDDAAPPLPEHQRRRRSPTSATRRRTGRRRSRCSRKRAPLDPRHRCAELVQLAPDGRGRDPARRGVLPDRGRVADRSRRGSRGSTSSGCRRRLRHPSGSSRASSTTCNVRPRRGRRGARHRRGRPLPAAEGSRVRLGDERDDHRSDDET